MSKKISKKADKRQITITYGGCGKTLEKDDIWYPFFDVTTCGGGILYLCAQCSVERVLSKTKEDILERVTEAEKEKNDPLSDGLMNFHWIFPISPIQWVKSYALEHDFEEIKQLVEVEKQNKRKSNGGK